jgi:hypothetical protein
MFTNERRDIPLPREADMAKMAALHAELSAVPPERPETVTASPIFIYGEIQQTTANE